MQNPEYLFENETHKILWDFEIQTDHLIALRRPDSDIFRKQKKKKKRTCRIMNFAVPADHRVKLRENDKIYQYIDLE